MIVTFNSSQIGGSANPAPAVSISVKSNTDSVTGRVLSKTVTWAISGVLLAKSESTIASQVEALQTLFSGITGSETFAMSDGLTLNGGDSINGLSVDLPSFPDGSGVQWGTKLNYTITAKADFWLTTAYTSYANYDINYSTDARGVTSRVISGTYFSSTGSVESGCKTWIDSDFAESTAYRRSLSIKLNLSTDGTAKSCSFTINDLGLFKKLPSSEVSSASVQKTYEIGQGGEGFFNLSLSFTGKNGSLSAAKEAADNVLNQYLTLPMISKSTSEDEYTGTYQVNARFFNINSSAGIVETTESITIQPSIQDFVIKPTLGGDPVKQNTVKRPAKAFQSGYTIRTSQNSGSANSPKWPNSVKKQSVTYHRPERGANNSILHYRTEWNYEFEFTETPSFNGY